MKKFLSMIFLAICITILLLAMMMFIRHLAIDSPDEIPDEIEIAKKEIMAWQGFTDNNTRWLDTTVVKTGGDIEDFYIVTCIVDEDELYEYKFAVTIEIEDDGFVDIDAYYIHKK